MQVGLRHFDSLTLDWLADRLRLGGDTRHGLARALCERTGWLNARSQPCVPAAAKALPVLAERLGLELPPPRTAPDPASAPAALAGDVPDTRLACALEELGPISLDTVDDTADRRLWEAMMAAYHPLGWARPPGGQVRWWIRSEHHGTLGGIGFGSATWRLRARDEWIGWSADALAANIGRVICNHRFLIMPGVSVYGLASETLCMAAARVADDWENRYSVRPVAAYTHVGREHDGYCYHRAGWTVAGRGSGRRGTAGTVRVLALEDGWRETLCHVDTRPIGTFAGAYDGLKMDWAEREYGRSGHTDGRIRRRIIDMGRAWLENMGEDLPVVFPAKAAQRAAYRLLSNPGVTMEHVLEPHFEATADRCRAEPLILAVQDTTALNYTGLEATSGLTGLGDGGGSVGLIAHVGLAMTPEGRPLGLFAMDSAFRDTPEDDSVRWLDGLDHARELAVACPDTRVISVCGREGDFWRMLARAADRSDALLVRASQFTKRRVTVPGGGRKCLWEHAASLPTLAVTEFTIPATAVPRARSERVARLEIRAAEIELAPPGRERGTEPLAMFAVSATEIGADSGSEPLHWLLLTTEHPPEGAEDAMHAVAVLDWYRTRWSVGTWFRTLKTGTRIRDRRLDAADDLRKCLAFDAVTACRVADLTVLAREHPETPATGVFPEEDVDLLHTLLESQGHRNIVRMTDGYVPDIRSFVIDLGRLVGAHPNPRQPMPGVRKFWRGLERLNWAVQVRDAIHERRRE